MYSKEPGDDHIYLLFYRLKVEQEEAHSIDDIARFHVLLVPRPPEFATYAEDRRKFESFGARFWCNACSHHTKYHGKRYRSSSLGINKKRLPEPSEPGSGRKETFWGAATAVGDHLPLLEMGSDRKEYETKTRAGYSRMDSSEK
jgi:hypothetical protein